MRIAAVIHSNPDHSLHGILSTFLAAVGLFGLVAAIAAIRNTISFFGGSGDKSRDSLAAGPGCLAIGLVIAGLAFWGAYLLA